MFDQQTVKKLEIWTKHIDDGRLLRLFTPQCHKKTQNSRSSYFGTNTRLRGTTLTTLG